MNMALRIVGVFLVAELVYHLPWNAGCARQIFLAFALVFLAPPFLWCTSIIYMTIKEDGTTSLLAPL